MRRFDFRLILGLGLLIIGILFLLQHVGLITGVLPLLWVLMFAASGLSFLYFYYVNREHWWAIIPGLILIGLAILIALNQYGPDWIGEISAAIFLLSISISFFLIYVVNRKFWWAIVPGGVIASVALMVALEPVVGGGEWVPAILFLGMTATFVALSFVKGERGNLRWALIPAAVLFVMSLVMISAATESFIFVFAGALVGIGILLIVNLLRGQRKASN